MADAHIFTVSALTREIKTLLEDSYPLIWISGEISNLARPSSGHCYFSLKDDAAVISGVMFRGQLQRSGVRPENGMRIVGMGRLALYEPRGSYQIIFEHMEAEGAGLLHARFEFLKKKLTDEGLFDPSLKKPLPFMPDRISIITSPTGAAVRDIINVIHRRFSGIHLEIVPVRVQGSGAAADIVQALAHVSQRAKSQVIILARGGGSLEDLAPFNNESVVRSVAAAEIPVISAVGHETDVSLCDFAADLRAPTPSAAAELCVPEKMSLMRRVVGLQADLIAAQERCLRLKQRHLESVRLRLKSPARQLDDQRMRLDDLKHRLETRMKDRIHDHRNRFSWLQRALFSASPLKKCAESRRRRHALSHRLVQAVSVGVERQRAGLDEQRARLEALSPMAILDRGYSITRSLDNRSRIITDAMDTRNNEIVEILLSRGRLHCEVKKQYGKEEDI